MKVKKTPIKIEYFRDILGIASREGELPNVCRSLGIYIGDVKTILYRKEIDLLKEVLIRAGEVDVVESSNWNSSGKSVHMEEVREEYDGSYYPIGEDKGENHGLR